MVSLYVEEIGPSVDAWIRADQSQPSLDTDYIKAEGPSDPLLVLRRLGS